MMRDKEARCIAAVEAFRVANKKSQELTTKMTEVERDKEVLRYPGIGVEKQAKASANNFAKPRPILLPPEIK